MSRGFPAPTVAAEGTPLVGQIEAYVKRFGRDLEPGWTVEIPKQIKARLLKAGHAAVPGAVLDRWAGLFGALIAREGESGVAVPSASELTGARL